MQTILLITHSSASSGGGEDEFTRLLVNLKKKYRIFTIIPSGAREKFYQENSDESVIIPSRIFPVNGFSFWEYLKFFLKSILKLFYLFPFIYRHRNEIDICYVNSSVCFVELLPIIFFKIKYVVCVKEVVEPEIIRNLIFKLYLKSACKILVISQFIKNLFENYDTCKVQKVYSTIDEDKYLEIKENFIKSKNLKYDKFTFLNIGPFYDLKCQDVLIKSFCKFEVHESVQLVLIGKPADINYYNYCKQLVEKCGNFESVFFKGEKNKEETIIEILKSHVVIIPSLREGFSLVLPEALLLEVPVISTNVGVVPEVINSGYNGLIFQINDSEELFNAMRNLKTNLNLYNKLKQNSLSTYYECFNMKESFNKIESILKEFI